MSWIKYTLLIIVMNETLGRDISSTPPIINSVATDEEKVRRQRGTNQRKLLSLSNDSCGVPIINPIQKLIINGKETEPGRWPWAAAIFQRNGPKISFICPGTLISNQHVLTANECVIGINLKSTPIAVKLGIHNIDDVTKNSNVKVILAKTIHMATDQNIILIELKKFVIYTNYIIPACLPRTNINKRKAVIIGWGNRSENRASSTLLGGYIKIVNSIADCLGSDPDLSIKFSVMDPIFCSDNTTTGVQPYFGDLGCGVYYKINDKWTVRGIFIYSNDKKISVYSEVYNYIDWITSKIE